MIIGFPILIHVLDSVVAAIRRSKAACGCCRVLLVRLEEELTTLPPAERRLARLALGMGEEEERAPRRPCKGQKKTAASTSRGGGEVNDLKRARDYGFHVMNRVEGSSNRPLHMCLICGKILTCKVADHYASALHRDQNVDADRALAFHGAVQSRGARGPFHTDSVADLFEERIALLGDQRAGIKDALAILCRNAGVALTDREAASQPLYDLSTVFRRDEDVPFL
ncbi:uncharacterized protein LOC117646178 [Thrips palmi]|uniref:Uncharacterized protein LOC117646178 n=1 Tax=Thrips palmi TaxID=161013 RepID=A0A6P8Z7M4_THRPL|nr:uncharacterized protein LOC117646178 [Thrips palmi]